MMLFVWGLLVVRFIRKFIYFFGNELYGFFVLFIIVVIVVLGMN